MNYCGEVRQIIFYFVNKKLQAQLNEMKQVHSGNYVWVDKPGLEMIFMAMTGYPSDKAPAALFYLIKNSATTEALTVTSPGLIGVGAPIPKLS
jgi:hypothetical protein